MLGILLYIVAPIAILLAGCGIGFAIGKVKYSPNIPPPNYLGGSID